MKQIKILFIVSVFITETFAQNSMVGDGFGGRLWYRPTNYTVGSYSAYSLCFGNPCDSSTNQLYGWGNNTFDQLGYFSGILSGTNTPIPIPNMNGVKYYSTGYNMGAIKLNGTGWVWGSGLFSTPTQVISNAKFVDGSTGSVGFVKNDGTVWSIGYNAGQFGDGTFISNYVSPVQMLNVNDAVRVACGATFQIILHSNGTVSSVGDDWGYGSLGLGSVITQTNFLLPISGLDSIVDIKATTYAAIAMDANGNVYSWGVGSQIGDGDLTNEFSPKKINSLSDIVAISGCADGFHFMALDNDKNCWAWGDNYWQFGLPPGGNPLVPTLVATDVIDIMAGETFSYIVKSDGSLWATGSSNFGSIWLNLSDFPRTTFAMLNPALVPGACNLVSVSANVGNSCGNNNGNITVNYNGGLPPYQYSIGGPFQSSNIFSGLSTGSYTVTVTDANACEVTTTVVVDTSLLPPPLISVNNASICSGTTATLTAIGAVTYIWSNASTLNSSTGATVYASPLSTTTYTVVGFNSDGCSDSATATVTVESMPVLTSSEDTICAGESVTLSAIGNGNNTWSPATSLNASTGSTVIAQPSTNTIYNVQTNTGPCVFNQSITINVLPSPTAIIQSLDSTAYMNNSVLTFISNSTNASALNWLMCDGTQSSNSSFTTVIDDIGNCCVKLIAENNTCKDSTSICFEVYQPYFVTIPNIFSPDGDGVNETFFLRGIGIENVHCEIYNRWGKIIYEWEGLNGYWNGMIDGKPASDGVYYFIVSYTKPKGEKEAERGFLTLIRNNK